MGGREASKRTWPELWSSHVYAARIVYPATAKINSGSAAMMSMKWRKVLSHEKIRTGPAVFKLSCWFSGSLGGFWGGGGGGGGGVLLNGLYSEGDLRWRRR